MLFKMLLLFWIDSKVRKDGLNFTLNIILKMFMPIDRVNIEQKKIGLTIKIVYIFLHSEQYFIVNP